MRPKRDKKTVRWKATRGTTITKKGYIRITAGPQRHMYLHRLLGAFKLKNEWDVFFDEEGGASVEFP